QIVAAACACNDRVDMVATAAMAVAKIQFRGESTVPPRYLWVTNGCRAALIPARKAYTQQAYGQITALLSGAVLFESNEQSTLFDRGARSHVDASHDSSSRRAQLILHLHRFH